MKIIFKKNCRPAPPQRLPWPPCPALQKIVTRPPAAATLPCPALFVTIDRQNHLIGPKIRVALLEDNGLKMQA